MTSHAAPPQVFVPVVTPFQQDQSIDRAQFIAFCRWLVSQGAGLAIFGTNSEASSLSLAERSSVLAEVVAAGIDPQRLLPGTGSCAVPEAVQLTREAVQHGCAGVLMLPPFYYKGVGDDGVAAYYDQVIQAVGSRGLKVYLYHIPQFTGVPITHALVERLLKDYPDTVVGLKDSSGDWANTESMLRNFPQLKVFPASEALLPKAVPLGAAGCISATANLQPGVIARWLAATDPQVRAQLAPQMTATRLRMQQVPMIPALKSVVAGVSGREGWRHVRPPFTPFAAEASRALLTDLSAAGFSMPGLEAALQ